MVPFFRSKVSPGEFPWESPCIARFRMGPNIEESALGFAEDYLDRHEYVMRYAWSVTDTLGMLRQLGPWRLVVVGLSQWRALMSARAASESSGPPRAGQSSPGS